jgi:hypothetical protein
LQEFKNSRRRTVTLRVAAVLGHAAQTACATVGKNNQQTFATPVAATRALLDALERDDKTALIQIFGSAYQDQIVTADWDAERETRQRIVDEANDRYALREVSDTAVELIVGVERWPFPMMILKGEKGWYFDTACGLDEIVNRRIGGNELTAIEVSRAYVDAQIEYARRDRNGDGYLEYAQRLSSSGDQRDGLYWKTSTDEEPSPFGPLVTGAERYLSTRAPGDPIRGYYFRVLTRQGGSAPGGRYDYVIDGRMITGFGLLAFPAEYDNTGAMTFVVSQRGVVYQKNLGPDGASIEEYDPDDSWSAVTN